MATYGPRIDQSQHAKSVSHIINIITSVHRAESGDFLNPQHSRYFPIFSQLSCFPVTLAKNKCYGCLLIDKYYVS